MMTHLAALDRQIACVVLVLAHPVRQAVGTLTPAASSPATLRGLLVNRRTNGRPGGEIAAAMSYDARRPRTQPQIGLDGVGALVLKLVPRILLPSPIRPSWRM